MADTLIEDPERGELETFDQANSPVGLLLRYARGRVRTIRFRFVVILAGVLVAGFFISWPVAAGLLTVMGSLELIEHRLMHALLRKGAAQVDMTRANRRVALMSMAQAAGIGFSIALIGMQGQALRLSAWVFLAGAALNSLLVARYHPPSHLARMAMYLCATLAIFLNIALSPSIDPANILIEIISVLLFIYMLLYLSGHLSRREDKVTASARELIKQKLEKSAVNRALEQSRRQLKRREVEARRLALVAEHATDSVILSDRYSTILWVNSQFTRITGYTAEEALGKSVGDLLNGPQTDPQTIENIKNAGRNRQPFKTHVLNYRKDGSSVWMEVSITPVFDDDGQFRMFISVERDATATMQKQAQLETALKAARKADQEKSGFLSRMSHELRTPINGIVGAVELLLEMEWPRDQRETIDILQQGADRMQMLVNDILEYSELSNDSRKVMREKVDLAQLLQDVTKAHQPAARAKGLLGPLLDPPEHPPLWVWSDASLLRLILNALLDNAVKFTDSGRIDLRLHVQQAGSRLCCRIEVLDTGAGIDKKDAVRVFERFTQIDGNLARKVDGAGLGLTIAQACAAKLGGKITLAPRRTGGSRFQIRLPLEPVVPPAEPAGSFLENPHLTLLVAEDNRTNRLLIEKIFKKSAVALEFAEDGVQAVQKYVGLRPNLVLMDISMPNKDGLQATRDIRVFEKDHNLPECPILALTANSFERDRRNCFRAGMTDFLAKPVRKKALFKALQTALETAGR